MTNYLGKMLGILFFAVIVAGALFFGLQYLSEWHEQEIKSALELQRKQFEAHYAKLEQELEEIETELDAERQAASLPQERAADVFGETATDTEPADTEPMDRCEQRQKRIDSFFDYIDEKTDGKNETHSRDVFFQMTADLAENPPLVTGETRDLITLLRNRAHFFRVLKKERIDMVRRILKTEKDVLESAMADFYAYYISEDRCVGESGAQFMPMPALYDYAGFFLETISGKSYLMRRDSVTRSLAVYYSILVLDRAIENGLNRHGIDIREHIDFAKDDIRHRRGLLHRQQYMETLDELDDKYR